MSNTKIDIFQYLMFKCNLNNNTRPILSVGLTGDGTFLSDWVILFSTAVKPLNGFKITPESRLDFSLDKFEKSNALSLSATKQYIRHKKI